MARWEPDARGRLEKAAMELFQERGYAKTTVEEIAARAGLTERTFFRYFTDKREVLFSGSKELEKVIVDTIASAAKQVAPLTVVVDAFAAAGSSLQSLRELSYVRARQALLAEHAELRERELIKLATLATVVSKALHARGVPELRASMTAEAGVAAFKVGFQRWVQGKRPNDVAAHIRAAMLSLQGAIGTPL
jgi:AcrR family transcriptional regulator